MLTITEITIPISVKKARRGLSRQAINNIKFIARLFGYVLKIVFLTVKNTKRSLSRGAINNIRFIATLFGYAIATVFFIALTYIAFGLWGGM